MFEIASLIGSPETDIVLETRYGSRIANSQAPAPDERAISIFGRLLIKHSDWRLRKDACGIYNCFGHVWAARRTAIYEQSGIDLIREDDGYRELSPRESPLYGDLAVYFDSGRNSIIHIGLVCELRQVTDASGMQAGNPAVWVLSKWNDSSGEVLHHLYDVPWADDEFGILFWSDRR